MNISDNHTLRECTSCQMCAAVCPAGAISISLNREGFYRPVVNDDVCTDCGLCVKSCYKFDSNIAQSDLSTKKMLAAWANDGDIVKETTSGGIADVLARQLVRDGYKCIGVAYDNDRNYAVGEIASTECETVRFRGSKYIQPLSVDAFKQLVKGCRKDKYAVFGLPCQIYAIDKFLSSRGVRENHILIDLYCHGCPSLHIWSKYVDEIMRKVNGKRVISVNFRSKVRGWGNFYVVVVVEGVSYPIEVVSPRINDNFYELFFSDVLLNNSCPDCQLRSTLEYTDIRLGDFWGKSYVGNHSGVSGITISTEKGENLVQRIKSEITVMQQSFDNFLPYQSYGKTYRMDACAREKILGMLCDSHSSLKDCVRAYHRTLSPKDKLKHNLKNVIRMMPNNLISSVKALFYSIQEN